MSKSVEIIAIGDELLKGFTINSNAAVISQKLSDIGLKVQRHRVVSDNHDAIVRALKDAIANSDVAITTGGLGPTVDDMTRQALAEVMGCDLVLNSEVFNHLKRHFGHKLPTLENQAAIPTAATPLLNSIGTAPGLLFEQEGCIVAVLPGVPDEMQELLNMQLIPYLKERFKTKKNSFSYEVRLHSTTEAEVDSITRRLKEIYPHLEIGIYPHLRVLTIRISGSSDQKEEGREACEKIKFEFAKRIIQAPTIAEEVHRLFKQKKLTLATAESCTGGRIASELTRYAGASDFFLGSVVSYSNESKVALLGVNPTSIEEHGAVSEEVVLEMCEGILEKVKSDWAIAVSGIAGPAGGTAEKPVGTVWCALAKKGSRPQAWKLTLRGNRETIIGITTHLALGKLVEAL